MRRVPLGISTDSIISPSCSRHRNFVVPSCETCVAAGSKRVSGKDASSSSRRLFGNSVASAQPATGASQSLRWTWPARYDGSPRARTQSARRSRASAGVSSSSDCGGRLRAAWWKDKRGLRDARRSRSIPVTHDHPSRIASRPGRRGTAPRPGAVPQPSTQDELVRRLSRTLDSLASAGTFAGAVALQRDGAMVFAHAYGLADRATQPSQHPGDRVQHRLDQQGLHGNGDPAARGRRQAQSRFHPWHLLARLSQSPARAASIRQLMEHQAGLGGNIFDPTRRHAARYPAQQRLSPALREGATGVPAGERPPILQCVLRGPGDAGRAALRRGLLRVCREPHLPACGHDPHGRLQG